MKHLPFLGLFVLLGCALSPLGPLDAPMTPAQRGPAGNQQYQAKTQREWALPTPTTADIYLGMESAGVRASWGRPEQVEYAGHPSLGQQRWIYTMDIPTPNGYIQQRRIVYFERDRVVGWETQGL